MADKKAVPAGRQVGVVSHYYDKIGVGIVKLNASLKVGDTVKSVGKNGEFTQEISSMQLEHQSIDGAKKGDEVGVKLDQRVKEKDQVFKL